MAGSSQEESNDDGASAPGASMPDGADAGASDDAPEASAQFASTAAADGSAGGTTVSIAVYRSSFPIVEWDLNDDDASLTKAEWAWTGDLPERGTPGAAVEWEAPSGYAEPTRAGFEFAGWSTDPSAPAGGYLDGSEPALSMPEGAPEGGEYRLFALWTPIEYSVVFDLSKNPGLAEGPLQDDLLDLTWESDQQAGRTVTPLGQGRYRVDGFTMREDGYDPATRTVRLPVPTRGGYWHVGWAEPEGQAIAIDSSDGWALNPVRLTQVDGTPVLTARWATGFGVTAPISVTFGDYDKTGSPENPSQGASGSSAADDTKQSEADDVGTPGLSDQERYEGAGQAYFENTSWHDAVKMVALESERDANANQVLTTYDSRKASEASVLGDGTEENPGERLLSLYPSATPGDASTGVHFRLDDALSEADLASFATLGERGTPSARLDVSYGLNLATDPVTGSANHGLVLDTDDYDRKPIARVSYAFAVADATKEDALDSHLVSWDANGGAWPDGSTGKETTVKPGDPLIAPSPPTSPYANFLGWARIDTATAALTLPTTAVAANVTYYAVWDITASFYVHVTATRTDIGTPGIYALPEIKAASNDISANGSHSTSYSFYKALLDAQITVGATPGKGPYFKCKIDNTYWDMQLIGIAQDTKTAGGKAGLTFQTRDIFSLSDTIRYPGDGNYTSYINSPSTNVGGWSSSFQRNLLRGTFRWLLPADLQSAIVPVNKYQQLPGGTTASYLQATTNETVWLPSMYEVFGTSFATYNESEALTTVAGYVPFQYMAYKGNDGAAGSRWAIKAHYTSATSKTSGRWWLRTAQQGSINWFCIVDAYGQRYGDRSSATHGIAPCFCL